MATARIIRLLSLDGDVHAAQVQVELEAQLFTLQRKDNALGVAHLDGPPACTDRHTCTDRGINAFDVRSLTHISRRADQIGRGAPERQARAHAADAKRIDLTAVIEDPGPGLRADEPAGLEELEPDLAGVRMSGQRQGGGQQSCDGKTREAASYLKAHINIPVIGMPRGGTAVTRQSIAGIVNDAGATRGRLPRGARPTSMSGVQMRSVLPRDSCGGLHYANPPYACYSTFEPLALRIRESIERLVN